MMLGCYHFADEKFRVVVMFAELPRLCTGQGPAVSQD